jgi:hypothetical protein
MTSQPPNNDAPTTTWKVATARPGQMWGWINWQAWEAGYPPLGAVEYTLYTDEPHPYHPSCYGWGIISINLWSSAVWAASSNSTSRRSASSGQLIPSTRTQPRETSPATSMLTTAARWPMSWPASSPSRLASG